MLLSQIEELFMVIKDYLRSFVTKIGVRNTEDQALPKDSLLLLLSSVTN